MTPGTLAQWGIAVEIHKPIPVASPQKFIVVQDVEWAEAVSMAIQSRKTHPEEAIEIYPRDHGLFTVVREMPL